MIGSVWSSVDTGMRVGDSCIISAEDYARHYQAWGGGFIQHPAVLRFIQQRFGIEPSYRGYFRDGVCICAIATWGPYLAGDRKALEKHGLTALVDFGYPLLYLPCAEGEHVRVRFRANQLLWTQRERFAEGACQSSQEAIAILRPVTQRNEFEMKTRRFLRMGGVFRELAEFSPAEICAMYRALFQLRWNRDPNAFAGLGEAFDRLRPFLFGKVMWLEDEAIAIHFAFRAETDRTICIDFINGGVDTSRTSISPGSLLSYHEGLEAWNDANAKGKLLIYSYGNADAEYKDSWCDRVPKLICGRWLV